MASYRAAVVGAWAELRDADRAHFGDLGHLPPRERLAQMMASHRRSAGPERVRRAFRRRFRLSGRWSWATGVVPALALLAAMPALGSAERAADIYTGRLSQRFLADEGVMQKDKPVAWVHLGRALVRLRSLRGLLADTVGEIDDPRRGRSRGAPRARSGEAAAAHIVHESRTVISDPLGASAHFLDNPLQRIKRDVDVIAGHVVFDYDTSPELAAALTIRYADPPHRDGVGSREDSDGRDRARPRHQVLPEERRQPRDAANAVSNAAGDDRTQIR